MSITDLSELVTAFEHVAHLQLYVQRFQEGFLGGKFDAIPGKEQVLKVGRQQFKTTSYAIFDDERFRRWHEDTLAQVREFRHDETKVASRSVYEGLTPEMFALLAAQARESQAAPAPAPEVLPRRGKSTDASSGRAIFDAGTPDGGAAANPERQAS